jgi:hypothetical protein
MFRRQDPSWTNTSSPNGKRLKAISDWKVPAPGMPSVAPVDLYPQIPRAADLIFAIEALLLRHMFFKTDRRDALLIAVWALGTYVYDVFGFFGYLWLNSPVKRCGKVC